MTDDHPIHLSQESDTTVTPQQRRAFGYRFAYSRSADSRAQQDKGQDYLAYRENGQKLVFALCDGVSQSFYGDLSARLLGEALVYWLWKGFPATTNAFQKELEAFLDSLVEPASKEVETLPVPRDLAPMIRQVLEQKRTIGSESTFVAGLLDFPARQLYLAWMGDSRIRLWGVDGEITSHLGDSFHTTERWSTRRGRIGNLHTFSMPLNEFRYLITYSDGLARLDKIMARHFRDASIDAIIEDSLLRPESDDISFFEVWSGGQRPLERSPLSAPPDVKLDVEEGQTRLRWRPVAHAVFYEVRLDDGKSFTVYAPGRSLDLPKEALKAEARSARVRAWDEEPGAWSAELTVPHALLQPVAPPPPPEVIPVPPPIPRPVTPVPVPIPLPLTPPPAPPRPTPLPRPRPVPARPSWLLAVASGGAVILLAGCLFGMLMLWPPIRGIFFPLPTFAPPLTLPRRTPHPTSTQIPIIPPLVPSIEVTLPTIFESPYLPPETPFPPVQSTPFKELSFCVKEEKGAKIRPMPGNYDLEQAPGTILAQGTCLSFDMNFMDNSAHQWLWLRVAPDQTGYENLGGGWVREDMLDPQPGSEGWRNQLPFVTLTPSPTPSSTPSPTATFTPTFTPSQTPSPTGTDTATPPPTKTP